MPRHQKVEANQRVYPVMDDYRMSCCDCGLVHTMSFRAVRVTKKHKDGSWEYEELDPKSHRIVLWADRNERATAQVRRWKKNK